MTADKGHIGKIRSGEVVIRSMISSQLAYMLTAIGPQLVVILNTLIVSRFLGEESFGAISAFNPISGILFVLINTCCIGPSIHAVKAYGELDIQKANRLFSLSTLIAAVVGIISAFILFAFKSAIAGRMTSDPCLQGLLVDYSGPISLYILLCAATCILNAFVTATGYVKKMTVAVLVSGITNIASIIILIKVFHSGVEAAGISMCISALTNIIILLPFVLGKRFPFRLVAPDSSWPRLVRDNAPVWVSVNSGSLSNGVFSFLINIVILHFLPSEGLFIWGVCQMAIIFVVIISCGIDEAYLYVDAFLIGEGDNKGRLKIAKGLFYEITTIMVSIAIILTLFTDKFATFFGADAPHLIQAARIPLICVSWFISLKEILITFGILSLQRRPLVKLNFDILVAFATPAAVLLTAVVLGGSNLWLGFAITPLLLVSYVAIVNAAYCRKDRNLMPFFLFNKINNVVSLDVSITYSKHNLQEELSRIRAFLNICEISGTLAAKIELCCEELMLNVLGMHSRGRTFDLRLSDCEDCVNLVVKNLGSPISPVINNEIVNNFLEKGRIPDNKELSMFYILHCGDKVDYRYVYGMNVAYLSFNKKD